MVSITVLPTNQSIFTRFLKQGRGGGPVIFHQSYPTYSLWKKAVTFTALGVAALHRKRVVVCAKNAYSFTALRYVMGQITYHIRHFVGWERNFWLPPSPSKMQQNRADL